MYLLVLGIVLVALKLVGIGPVADWPWWGVMLPFPIVSLWWAVSDLTGLTKRRAAQREEARRIAKLRKQLERNGVRHSSYMP
ncbi:TIGR04438 family Trp-rich protein [Ramlibacter sp. AN1015]|uniref:TIGR04438 family Trp-rich protein n=1 Tax=Ramlibacter sp. AN1015 TaxID=3133428 RepID=UPI0030BAD2BA